MDDVVQTVASQALEHGGDINISIVVMILMGVVWILREVKSFGGTKWNKERDHDRVEIKNSINEIKEMTEDLYKWHDVTDSDGTKLWYVKGSLEKAMVDLSNNISAQTAVLQAMMSKIKDVKREVMSMKIGGR